MTQPIHTLPPAELRGYARGLRETAARLGTAWGQSGMVDAYEMSLMVAMIRDAWTREAEMVEGFAARLPDDASPAPAPAAPICPEADAECLTGCTILQDGRCAWNKPAEPAPAPKAAPEPPAPATGRPTSTWTEAREALLTLLYPTIICPEAIYRLVQALPGPPIASLQAMRQRARAMDLERRGQPLPAGYTDQPLATRSPMGMPGHLKTLTPPVPRANSPWSEERLALLRRLMPTIMHLDAIHAALNALPGPPIPTPDAVRAKAAKLDIHRRGAPVPEDYATATTARTRAPQAATSPLSAEEQAESWQRLDAGESLGAKDLAEWFGCPLEAVQPIVDAWRKAQRSAA